MANASPGYFGARLSARLQQSANVLRNAGTLRFLELSASSLIEPVRSMRLRVAVSADAKRALLKIKNGKHGRGLFIDCGSNIGQGYTFFSNYYKKEYFDYILIEPDKNCLPHLQALRESSGANIAIISKAASVRDGFAQLFRPPSGQGEPTYGRRSIVPDSSNSLYQTDNPAADIVETFSLSQLILSNSSSYDVIVLKMDVDGSEYELLFDIIKNKVHHIIYATYIDFQSIPMREKGRDTGGKINIDLKKYVKNGNILLRDHVSVARYGKV